MSKAEKMGAFDKENNGHPIEGITIESFNLITPCNQNLICLSAFIKKAFSIILKSN